MADSASWSTFRSHWTLPREVTYLNHGSFGPSPREVMAERTRWFERLESQPCRFYLRELEAAIADARAKLAELVGTSAERLVFVENATTGMNVVADSVKLSAGDEVLLNDHEYGSVRRIWQRACARSGATLVEQKLSVPVQSAEHVVEELWQGVSSRTRLIVVSHVTSPTAICLPVEAICRRARDEGILTCVDGPHAVAMRSLSLDQLACDFYTASCHKWLCAPFGTGFLYVCPEQEQAVEPSVMSWGHGPRKEQAGWQDEFLWVGTRDPSAFLSVPAAINFLAKVGWDAFRQRTHELARLARERIVSLTGTAPLVPDSQAWYGSMIAVPLPPGPAEPLQDALWERYSLEVPIIAWGDRRLVRVSCHLYTQEADLEKLREALAVLLPEQEST